MDGVPEVTDDDGEILWELTGGPDPPLEGVRLERAMFEAEVLEGVARNHRVAVEAQRRAGRLLAGLEQIRRMVARSPRTDAPSGRPGRD